MNQHPSISTVRDPHHLPGLRGLGLTLLACAATTGAARAQNEIWIEQHGSASWDRSSTATADGSGGVFVAGTTGGNFGGPHVGSTDAWLGRFDAAGNLAWLDLVGTTAHDDIAASAPDAAGGVYVTGLTVGNLGGPSAGSTDSWVARYDGAGNQLWIRQFALPSLSPAFSADIATAAAPDDSGGVFVAGYTNNQLGGQGAGLNDVFITRYDSAGNQLWAQVFGTPTKDSALCAAPDGTGGLFVGGQSDGSLGGPNSGSVDVWIARYDGAGNQVWILQFGSSAFDSARSLCPDTAGGLFVTGTTQGDLAGAKGSSDVWIARFGAAGNQKWIRQIGTNTVDDANFCTPDGSGGCFVGGDTRGSLGGPHQGSVNLEDAWLARYDREGDQLWIKQVATTTDDHANGAATDTAGGVYLFGHTGGVLGDSSMGGPDDIFLARYDGECQSGKNYCTALVTSGGCLPSIDSDGVPSLAKPGSFLIRADQLEQGQFGLAFFGTTGAASIPFLGGTMCVGSPVYRLLAGQTGGLAACAGTLQYSLSALLAHPSGSLLTPGTEVHCQAWFRDPQAAEKVGLTDGLRFTICN